MRLNNWQIFLLLLGWLLFFGMFYLKVGAGKPPVDNAGGGNGSNSVDVIGSPGGSGGYEDVARRRAVVGGNSSESNVIAGRGGVGGGGGGGGDVHKIWVIEKRDNPLKGSTDISLITEGGGGFGNISKVFRRDKPCDKNH